MVKKLDFKGITILNNVMNNNEFFKASISTDDTIRHEYNIEYCIGIMELYSYLLRNSYYICSLFGPDTYYNSKTLTFLLDCIVWNKMTPKQAILKRIETRRLDRG